MRFIPRRNDPQSTSSLGTQHHESESLLTGMINNLISPPPCFSSQVTSKGSHCIGVEMLNLIALTAEDNASNVMSRSTAGVIKTGMVVKV